MGTQHADIYRSAAEMIENHGDLAVEASGNKADHYLESGNIELSLAWTRIKLAVADLIKDKSGQKRH